MIKANFDVLEFAKFVMTGDELIKEAKWFFRIDGVLEFTAMDSLNIVLVHSWIPDSRKDHCFEEEKVVLVNLVALRGLMKDFVGEDFFTDAIINLVRDCDDKVNLWFDDKFMILEVLGWTFKVPVEISEEKNDDMKTPELSKLICEADTNQAQLEYAIKKIGKVGESIKFMVKDGKLFLYAGEDEFISARYELCAAKGPDCSSKFSSEYLKRVRLMFSDLKIFLGDDYPIKIADQAGNYFCIAPRVDRLKVHGGKNDVEGFS